MADGFYRVKLTDAAVPHLGVIFPHFPGEEELVAFPLVLPMGWVESPPYFCAVTETVADIANGVPARKELWPHELETLAKTQPEDYVCPSGLSEDGTRPLRIYQRPLAVNEVYVDDFIQGVQGNEGKSRHHIAGDSRTEFLNPPA